MRAVEPPNATPADLIVTGCTVLVHDDEEGIGFRDDAAIVVRDRVIDAVTTAAAARDLPAVTRIEALGQVALPGLINCHTHAPMAALRGLAEDLPTESGSTTSSGPSRATSPSATSSWGRGSPAPR
ncbi:hypothetical protein LT493_01085 [Streptomyces tricolor]|nr:hypothetical protein [Streptomyces tricolor]